MDKIKVIVVDDERRSRELLLNLLSDFDFIKIVATAENVDHAFELIKLNTPDLVFLDIQMPTKNGFELVKMINNEDFKLNIIFTTAYDSYAVKAFRFAAFDYLLKPIKIPELESTLNRYMSNSDEFGLKSKINGLNEFLNKEILKLNLRTGTLIIEPEELVLCVADGNYTHLHLCDGKQETITFNIGEIQKMLPVSGFFRIDRSHILNLNYLKKIDNKGKSIYIKLNDDYMKIKIGKENIKRLHEII